jgi:hypothetical protein
LGSVAAWIGNGVLTPWPVRVASSAAGMASSANDATAGSASVTLTGSANSP